MAGEHRHPAGIVADEVGQTAPDLHGSVPVVGQGQDAPGVLPPHPNQVRDAMHQYPGLPRAGSGQDQHVGLLPVVGDDTTLYRIVQAPHDSGVVCRDVSWSRPGSQRSRNSASVKLK